MRDDAANKASVALVERRNAAIAPDNGTLWSPTIRAAVLTDRPWLDVHCPGFLRECKVLLAAPGGTGRWLTP
jgi:hypothetical protein